MSSTEVDAAAGAALDVARARARLPGRAALLLASRSGCRCSPRCPTRCSRSGSSSSPTACSAAIATLVLAAARGLGVSAAATWFLRVVSDRMQRRFRDQVTIALESHVARLQASVATIAHHERPEYLDRLSMLRDQVFVLDHMYMSLFTTCGWILRLGVTLALLVSIHPALALLAVFALPTVLTSTWRPGVERVVEERGAPANRLARHLFDARHDRAARQGGARDAASATRLVDAAPRGLGALVRAGRARALGERRRGTRSAGRSSARPTSARSSSSSRLEPRPPGQRAARARGRLAPVGLHRRDRRRDRLPARHLARRLAAPGLARGLRRVARAGRRRAGARAPREGIRFEHVSFAYPGTERLVLDDVNLELAPGAVVAIVGENGAGKTHAREAALPAVRADARAHPGRRRRARAHARRAVARAAGRRVPGLLPLRVPRAPDRGRRRRAAARRRAGGARGGRARGRRRRGRAARRGPRHAARPDLARGRRRVASASGRSSRSRAASCASAPLVLVLDEPTAALDAETEHALFERYAAAARGEPTAASPCSSRTASPPCAWPTSSSCSTARAWSRSARTTS